MTWLTTCSTWNVHSHMDSSGLFSGTLAVNMMVEFNLERDTIIMKPVLTVDVMTSDPRVRAIALDQLGKLMLSECYSVPIFTRSVNQEESVEGYIDVDPWGSMKTILTRVELALREVNINIGARTRLRFETRATREKFLLDVPHLLMLVRTMSLPPERSGGLLYGDTIPSCIFWESCHVEVIYELLRWRAARPEAFDATLAALSQVRTIRGSWEGRPR